MSEQARLEALIADYMPVLEEFADTCETVTRSVRCISLLMSAKVEPERMMPHFATAKAAFASLSALTPRLESLQRKYGG